MTITEFLEARVAEDEAVARAATPGPWEWGPETDEWSDCGPNLETVAKLPPYPDGSVSPVGSVIGAWGHDAWGVSVDDGDKAHIARHDPARVLAECAAKRAIIRGHRRVADLYEDALGDTCTACFSSGPDAQAFPCATVRALAAVYADHADYRDEWEL